MKLHESRIGRALLGLPILAVLALSACAGELPLECCNGPPDDACIWIENRWICP